MLSGHVKKKTPKKLAQAVDELFGAFDGGVAVGLQDYQNKVLSRIYKQGFLHGRQKRVWNDKTKRWAMKFVEAPGANKTNSRGEYVFHKSKIMERTGSLKEDFTRVRFTPPVKKKAGIISRGRNQSEHVAFSLFVDQGNYTMRMEFSGQHEVIWRVYQYGRRYDGGGRNRKRAIISNGYAYARRLWKEAVRRGIHLKISREMR